MKLRQITSLNKRKLKTNVSYCSTCLATYQDYVVKKEDNKKRFIIYGK